MSFFSTAGAIVLAPILAEVVKMGREYIKDTKNSKEDVFTLGLRMSAAIDRTETIQNIYFGTMNGNQNSPHEAGNAPFPIFENLKLATKVNVIALMHQYHDVVLLKYKTLHAAYDLASSQEDPTSSSQKNKKRNPKWALTGKREVQEMLEECEQWNEKLFEIIQINVLEKCLQLLSAKSTTSGSSGFEKIRTNTDVRALGLNEEIDLIQISEDRGTRCKELELWTGIDFDDKSRGPLKLGTYNGRKVLGEFKGFQPQGQESQSLSCAEPPKEILERIRQLAALLNKQHSIRSRLLRCTGFYRDQTSLAYVFVLEYPSGRGHNPVPLQNIIWGTYKCKKPALECRLKLALTLAISLFQFHTVGWVHKSFRSSNILCFPTEANVITPEDISEPWLVGFEYSRQDPGFSENPTPEIDVASDIYRHPDRWGQPTTKFGKMHDVYSLGLALLEIGMWQDLTKFDRYEFKRIEIAERFQVQELFVQQARDKLPFMTGSAYADVVVKCLTGEFEVEESDSDVSPEELYRKQILDALRRVSGRF